MILVESILRDCDELAATDAGRLRDKAASLHRNAPRGGLNMNRHGQQRSAPGEAPAVEDGELLAAIEGQTESSMRVAPGVYEVVVNRADLEFGTRRVAPRPLGRMALSEL